ncbi:MAG TPA: type II secretion system protein [Pyrinomonadaceae bacterium]|nr:type II secretion system protein [Pyrinomonadaceae bacterium]
MNLRVGPHHNMWVSDFNASSTFRPTKIRRKRTSESGYTLVALLAMMTILALFAMAAAPSMKQQSLREREIETIFRGEEVANAIRLYYNYQITQGRNGPNALPTSMDQLLEGVSVGTKKIQILRQSAAHDLLSESGEWRLVKPRSGQITEFTRSVMLFANNVRPPTNDPQLKQVELDMAPPIIITNDLQSSPSSSAGDDDSSGPFIGVATSNSKNSVLTYYGIDKHDAWIFTPLFR